MIELEGLTPRQMIIADLVWACGTKDEIDRLIHIMPTKEMKDETESIVQMMIIATIEECVDGRGEMKESNEVLKRIFSK